ncbi:MAG: endonuclease [Bacteroidota bacterium]
MIRNIRTTISIAWILVLFFPTLSSGQDQSKKYRVSCIGFYNLENLYDTVDDPEKSDEEFLPNGTKRYTAEVYKDKLHNLATVISQIGTDDSPDGLSILGVAEIENRKVLEDLAAQPELKSRNYKVVHYDSPDRRGVDVALFYNPKYFRELNSGSLNVPLKNQDGTPYATRDVLWVYGLHNGEPVHLFVNHWPSRRGGEEASAPSRALAASVARAKIDSITAAMPEAKVILMGDLNDDPVNVSVTEVLKASYDRANLKPGFLYNPWNDYYSQGIGTLAYNDAWNLFDQIVISQPFLQEKQDGYFYHKAVIFNRPYLFQKSGRYKGYPMRTYDFDIYIRGYSDHLPVYVVLMKQVD